MLDLFLDRPGAVRAFGDGVGAGIRRGAEQQFGSTEPDAGFQWRDGTP